VSVLLFVWPPVVNYAKLQPVAGQVIAMYSHVIFISQLPLLMLEYTTLVKRHPGWQAYLFIYCWKSYTRYI